MSSKKKKRVGRVESEYEKGQGMRISQDYGRCRNGKGVEIS